MPEVIDRFTGNYKFLSNFYYHKFKFEGATYRTAEHCFQAQKTHKRHEIVNIKGADSPGAAKRLGRNCTLREDWDLVKHNIMERIVRAKFKDPEMAKLLAATGDAELIEGNSWYDTFWGVCNGRGSNHLGKILMKVREELK
jgi:ribA/ribD-fused uncharacterized protein